MIVFAWHDKCHGYSQSTLTRCYQPSNEEDLRMNAHNDIFLRRKGRHVYSFTGNERSNLNNRASVRYKMLGNLLILER